MSKANWPVYTMPYRCSGVEKQLRLEWHHVPKPGSPEVVIQCIKDYIKNPQDQKKSNNGDTFKTLLPDYCIVQADGHKTQTSKTDRAPDTTYHISVRFGKLADRAEPGKAWAYSVHIYLNENTNKYDPTKKVIWDYPPTSDRREQLAVYKDRTEWPPGATATTAPPAPGEQLSVSTPSTQELAPAPLPATNPWGGPRSLSPQPNPHHSVQRPDQGPSSGAPPLGRARGG